MRLYHGGKFVRHFSLNDHPITQKKWTLARAKARTQRFIAGCLKVVVALLILTASAYVVTVEAENTFAFDERTIYEKVVETVNTPNEYPAILLKIAKCESGGTHYAKNGQVLINKTRDIGFLQINTEIWGKKATELGYDLMNEADNKAFGLWIFQNYGSEPWHLSAKCWSK